MREGQLHDTAEVFVMCSRTKELTSPDERYICYGHRNSRHLRDIERFNVPIEHRLNPTAASSIRITDREGQHSAFGSAAYPLNVIYRLTCNAHEETDCVVMAGQHIRCGI